ncbi:ankyrin repeat-containing domain protein [Aspergillus undulatus]|uniref:ankyrin repeat-containing domain protein n=1 Tax=Aspergillus undulatus TaxID=1810928 RepID=UPI003CCE157A
MASGGAFSATVSIAGDEVPGEETSRLKLLNTLPSQLEENDKTPHVDVIHVVGVDPERRLDLDTILGDSVSPPARIFVAYDLGALVVKKAFSLAAASAREPQCPGIFYSTIQIIYWGCFQRRRSLEELDMKIWQFLQAHKEDAAWAPLVAPSCIRALANASIDMTELFLCSGSTLRTRIVSIYADEGSKKTDPMFDFFTATLGVSTEIAVQEDPNSENGPVSGLDKMLSYRNQTWAPDVRWTELQRMLLPLAFPQHQYTADKLVTTHKILESQAYKDWASMRKSPILYIQGQDADHSRSLAETVSLYRQSKLQKKETYGTCALPFTFSSRDPARASMDRMIISTALQCLSAFESESATSLMGVLLDLHSFQRGWTLKDLENLVIIYVAPFLEVGGFLVLHDVDECELTSRKAFWDIVQRLADLSDSYLKVIVTSRRKLSLLADCDEASSWCLYHGEEDTDKGISSLAPQPPDSTSLVSRLCPGGHGEPQVRKALESLKPMDSNRLGQILSLIQNHSNWPDVRSPRTWSAFEALLNRVQPSTSPATVLDWILRSIPDSEGLHWAFIWLAYGHRPLKSYELAQLLCYCDRGKGYRSFASPVSSTEVDGLVQLLKTWLSAVAEFSHARVSVRAPIGDLLLDENPDYLWNEVKPDAHLTILEFLKAYLTAPEISERLEKLYEMYISETNADNYEKLAPSFSPAGEELVFYAVTAFPYHVVRCPQFLPRLQHLLSSDDQRLLPWAKMYWAMSNPFTRPSVETIDSPLSIFLNAEILDPSLCESLRTTGADQIIRSMHPELDDENDTNAAVRALSVGNEDAALQHAQHLISKVTSGEQSTVDKASATLLGAAGIKPLLSKLLWRATWLNMHRLAEFLLKAGASPEPKDVISSRYPSPLYLASIFGHCEIVQALLQAGANIRVLRSGKNGVLFVAAVNGHTDTIHALVAKDKELLEMKQPLTPLYSAASWGQWQAVRTLLALGARPDYNPDDDGWSPLIAACKDGYIQTVRALLEYKADPNLRGPDEQDTALWFASMRAKSIPVVRALLEHGADPNHEFLQPPLVAEICRSTEIKPGKKVAILDVLIDNSPPIEVDKVDSYGTTGLMWATTRGEIPVVEWLLARNANISAINNEKQGPLYYAVMNDHLELVQNLLTHGAPVNALTGAGDTMLQLAIDRSTELVRVLLDGGANPELESSDGSTAINTAVQQEKTEIVKLLIERKVDLEHRDSESWCPIHDASGHAPNAEIARLLAEAGVKLTETTNLGWSPLLLAAKHARADVLTVLLEFQGALDLEQATPDGDTPLIKAVRGGSLECIRRLLQAGANLNAQRPDGWTALMIAISEDKPPELVDLLLSRPGLDIDCFSQSRGTALHFACTHLELDIVTKLLDHGAEVNQQTPGIWPTALVAVCMPSNMPKSDDRSENIDKIDKIVRVLVDRGANLDITYSRPISNLLCAAMLGSGPSTINYLLSKGLSLKERGNLDRLPIHYAAANGIENFNAALLSDRDLSYVDAGGKSALHWAAQFGHVQTVEKILAHAPTAEERQKRLHHADVDGWTALCWALRPHSNPSPVSYSEPCDLDRTVQVLLENGADVSMHCRLGQDDEKFTPLELAKLHDSSEEIIDLLTEADAARSDEKEDKTVRAIRPYTRHGYYCDVCLNSIWGPVHRCQTCAEFDMCKKCFGRVELYHGYVEKEDGQPHTFKLIVEAESEIKEPSEAGAEDQDKGSQASEDGDGSDGGGHHDGDTVVVNDTMEAIMNYEVDGDFGSPDVQVSNSP